MYLEALKAILFLRILPPEKQTITKGILVNKLCLTSLCKNIFNECKTFKTAVSLENKPLRHVTI